MKSARLQNHEESRLYKLCRAFDYMLEELFETYDDENTKRILLFRKRGYMNE